MQSILTIGLDIAKSVFQVHGVDAAGQVVLRRQTRRSTALGIGPGSPDCWRGDPPRSPPSRSPTNSPQRSNAFVKYEPGHSRPSPMMRLEQRRMTNVMEKMDEYTRQTSYILIVDKDPTIRQNVSEYFSDHNILTRSAPNWNELKCAGAPPSLIVMDQQTGRNNGLDKLRSIRLESDVPVIMTGQGSDEIDRVVGLELGADDYLVKPFSPRELLARARAILRRRGMTSVARTRDSEGGGYRFGGWRLERRRRKLVAPNETQVSLSKGEYALLVAFLESPQRPLTREHLLQTTRVHADIFDRSIDVQVLRLRRKLEIGPSAPRVIQTERGIGYVFALPVERF